MKILLVDNHTKDNNELNKLLSNYDFSICTKEEFSSVIGNTFDVVIFSGGSGTGVSSIKGHEDIYKNEIDFIKNTNKKVIGICLGCQIIATAFGCTLKELDIKEKGITNINFKGTTTPIYEAHRFIIDQVSDDIEILAFSDHGIEMIQHKTKPIYGLQFHPEMFVEKTKGAEIFLNILNT